MTPDRIAYRCAACGFLLDDAEPRVWTPQGWAHPVCSEEES